jgi:hypothetical protein
METLPGLPYQIGMMTNAARILQRLGIGFELCATNATVGPFASFRTAAG